VNSGAKAPVTGAITPPGAIAPLVAQLTPRLLPYATHAYSATKILFFIIAISTMFNMGQYANFISGPPQQSPVAVPYALGATVAGISCFSLFVSALPAKLQYTYRSKYYLIILAAISFVATVADSIVAFNAWYNVGGYWGIMGYSERIIYDRAPMVISALASTLCLAFAIMDKWMLGKQAGEDKADLTSAAIERIEALERKFNEIELKMEEKKQMQLTGFAEINEK